MENRKEQMDEAIARAKEEVADEVRDHQAEDKALEEVVGGAGEGLGGDNDPQWYIVYKTTSDTIDDGSGST